MNGWICRDDKAEKFPKAQAASTPNLRAWRFGAIARQALPLRSGSGLMPVEHDGEAEQPHLT